MSDIFPIPNIIRRDDIFSFITWLKDMQVENYKNENFDLYTFSSRLSKSLEKLNYDEDNNHLILFLTCVSILFPNSKESNLNYDIFNNIKSKYLYSINLSSICLSIKSDFQIKLFLELFFDEIDSLFEVRNKGFFEISKCYFYLTSLPIVSSYLFKQRYFYILEKVFDKILELDQEQINNYSNISFISKIFKFIKQYYLTYKVGILNFPKFKEAFLYLIKMSEGSCGTFLSLFFNSWFYFAKDRNNLTECLQIIVSIFENVSTLKHHELHRTFQWYLCVWFYDFIPIRDNSAKIKILNFLYNGIRTVPNLCEFSFFNDSTERISKSLLQQHITSKSTNILYFFSCIDSCLTNLCIRLGKIHLLGHKTSGPKKIHKNLHFVDQNIKEKWIFDEYLYSHVIEINYNNDDEFNIIFGNQIKHIEYIQKSFITISAFELKLLRVLREFILHSSNNFLTTTISFQYFQKMFLTFFNFMIIASLKQTETQVYVRHTKRKIQDNLIFPTNLETKNLHQYLDFNIIYKQYYDILGSLSNNLSQSLAYNVSKLIYKSIKNDLISLKFTECFSCLQKEKNNNQNHLYFFNSILNYLMQIAVSKTNLLFSSSSKRTSLIYNLVMLTTRIAICSQESKINYNFSNILKLYQNCFIFSIFYHLKSIQNRTIVMRFIHHYFIFTSKNYYQNIEVECKPKYTRFKQFHHEEIDLFTMNDFLHVIMVMLENEPSIIYNLTTKYKCIETALCSNNSELVSIACNIVIKIINDISAQNTNTNLSETEKSLLRKFFSTIKNRKNQNVQRIIFHLTNYGDLYLDQSETELTTVCYHIYELGIDIDKVLSTIISSINDTEEEIFLLFNLITNCFDDIIKNIESKDDIFPVLSKLISLLYHLYGKDRIQKNVISYSVYITHIFADFFLKGKSNLYILCIFDSLEYHYEFASSFGMKLAVSFFEYCQNKPFIESYVKETLYTLYTFPKTTNRLFSLLNGLSLFLRFYPNYINVVLIRGFLIQTQDVQPFDIFPSMLNKFLKCFLTKADQATRKEFVNMGYEIIPPLNTSVRIVLEKRISKLGIPLNIKSLDEIANGKNSESPLFYIQRLTLAFLCGIEGDIASEVSENIIEKALEFCNISQNDPIPKIDKISRMLSLFSSILKNSVVFNIISQNNNFIHKNFEISYQALLSPMPSIKKLAKKNFQILKKQYPSFLSDLDDDERWKSFYKKLRFWNRNIDSTMEFYIQITNMFPEKTPPNVISDLIIVIYNFLEKEEADQLRYLPNLFKVIEFIGSKNYIQQKQIKDVVLKLYNDKSYLFIFIDVVLKLMQKSTLPFLPAATKHILNFLREFSDHTILYLINNNDNNSLFNIYFIEFLILKDDTSIFLNSFLEYLHNIKDYEQYSYIKPEILQIITNITQQKRFGTKDKVIKLIWNMFRYLCKFSTEKERTNNYNHSNLIAISHAILNTFEYSITIESSRSFLYIFKNNLFLNSDIYSRYIELIFRRGNQIFIDNLFQMYMKNIKQAIPKISRIILPHCIKSLNTVSNIEETWEIFFTLMEKSRYTLLILKCMYYLIDKSIPTPLQTSKILETFKLFEKTNDTQILITLLKIGKKLSKIDLMPMFVYESVLIQALSFSIFFDEPYFQYIYSFLLSNKRYIDKLSIKTIENISYYFYDKLSQNSFYKLFIVANNFSQILRYLPFSIIVAISSYINNKLNRLKQNEDINEISQLITQLIIFCNQSNPNNDELMIFYNVIFSFIQLQIKNTKVNEHKQFIDMLYRFILKCSIEHFQFDILNSIGNEQISTLYQFNFICCAGIFDINILFYKFNYLIDFFFQYCENKLDFISEIFLVKFISKINEYDYIYLDFKTKIDNLFKHLIDIYTSEFYKLLRSFTKIQFINCSKSETLKIIDKIWLKYQNNEISILKILIKAIKWTNYEFLKIPIFNKIMKDIFNNDQKIEIFLLCFPSLIKSNTISYSSKQYFIQKIPQFISKNEYIFQKIIDSVNIFLEDEHECKYHNILLNLSIAKKINCIKTIFYIEEIEKYLPCSIMERFDIFINDMPIDIWDDETLIYIIALLTPKTKISNSIFALSSRLTSISDEIAIPILSNIILDKVDSFGSIFSKFFYADNKRKYKHIISSLITIAIDYNIKIEYKIVEKLFKKTEKSNLIPYFLHENILIDDPYILENNLIGSIFGFYYNNISIKQKAGLGLTFLNQYELAENMYKEYNSMFIKQFQNFNLKFIINSKNNNNYSLSNILQPIRNFDKKNDTIYNNLIKVTKLLFENNKASIHQLLDLIEQENSLIIKRSSKSLLAKEMCVVIEMIIVMIRNKIENVDKIPLFRKKQKAFLNPTFYKIIIYYEKLLLDSRNKVRYEIINDRNACMILPSSYLKYFRKVSFVTSRGLFGVSQEQIKEVFNEIQMQMYQRTIKDNGLKFFASFCFDLFCSQQTIDYFNAAFSLYCHLFKSTNNIYKQIASARIITLVRIVINNNENYANIIIDNSKIFKKEYSEFWRNWINQLISLSKTKWFSTIPLEIFKEMFFISNLYAKKHNNRDLQYFLENSNIKDKYKSSQVKIMELILPFYNEIIRLNDIHFIKQKKFIKLAEVSLQIQNEELDKMDLLEIRKSQSKTNKLERAISLLNEDDIELIGNFSDWVKKIKSLTENEIENMIMEMTNSDLTYSKISQKIYETCDNFNSKLPIVFPYYLDPSMKSMLIIRVHNDFKIFSEKLFSFKAVTSNLSSQEFLIQKDVNGQDFSVYTLPVVLYIFQLILNKSYQSRIQRIHLFSTEYLEIDENSIIIPIKSQPDCLINIFEDNLVMSKAKWISKYVKNHTITEEGKESISKCKKNLIYERFNLNKYKIISFKKLIIGSYSAISLLRYIFSAPYPNLDSIIFCKGLEEMPILYTDFSSYEITKETAYSSFRLSPVIVDVIGNMHIMEFSMGMAAMAHALIEHLESTRALIEVLICDKINEYKLENILETRTIIENKLIELSQPTNKSTSSEECIMWINNLTMLVEKSRNPEIQPYETIPWF